MPRLSREDLRKLREDRQRAMTRRDAGATSVQVIVGMGSCGIAAGAKAAFDAFADELNKNQMKQVVVGQTGCMGLCHSEPTAEVRMPGLPDIVYGCVTPDVARRIVQEHIRNGRLVGDHVFDKPANDLVPTLCAGKK